MKKLMDKDNVSIVKLYPRFEGSNINTWIGFKHVMYLAEEAVIQHFRDCGFIPRLLYEDHGICFEIVDHSIRILHALHMDDLAEVHIFPAPGNTPDMQFKFTIFVEREGKQLKACTGKISVLFRKQQEDISAEEIPEQIFPHVVAEIDRTGYQNAPRQPAFIPGNGRGENNPQDALIARVVPADANAFVWKWHIPYIYSHFSKRLQMSGYVRLMEEAEDLFLADRGISIYTFLSTRQWIPVVPAAKIQILREAIMEETIYTVYSVNDIFRDATYTHDMNCYVVRDGALVHTAAGTITHGYARVENRKVWKLVSFDDVTMAALQGKKPGA